MKLSDLRYLRRSTVAGIAKAVACCVVLAGGLWVGLVFVFMSDSIVYGPGMSRGDAVIAAGFLTIATSAVAGLTYIRDRDGS